MDSFAACILSAPSLLLHRAAHAHLRSPHHTVVQHVATLQARSQARRG